MNYYFEELKYLGERLGIDRHEVLNCLERAARNPKSIPIYKKHFLRLLKKEGFTLSDLPAFGRLIEQDKRKEGIPVGRMAEAKETQVFYLPSGVFKGKHVFIAGMTGSGKSRLVKIISKNRIESGEIVLIVDSADEHWDLCQFFPPETFLVVDPRRLKINFQHPPPNVEKAVWRGFVINTFRESMFLRDGACNELNSIMTNLSGTKIRPTFLDLYRAVMNKSYRAGSRKAQYIESLQNRCELFLNSEISDALMCAEGHPLEQVFIERSSDLRVGKISNDLVRNFYVNFVLNWIEVYLTYNPREKGK